MAIKTFDISELGNSFPDGTIYSFPESQVKLIKFRRNQDQRGEFSRLFDKAYLMKASLNFKEICQVSISRSLRAGTFRGVHVQTSPSIEIKCIRVIDGSIIDYVIDLNQSSEHFGSTMAIKIDSNDEWGILIPSGFGHAIFTTSDNTVIAYAMNSDFVESRDVSIHFSEPLFGIVLPFEISSISEKDANAPSLSQMKINIG